MGAPFRVKQNTAAIYTATLKDENEVVIPLAELATLTLTLFNVDIAEPTDAEDNIINSRDEQDVKNANNVTYHPTSGLLTWILVKEDNKIFDETKATELHVARFDFTYGSAPLRHGAHEVRFRVENLRKVASL